jgi:hypothetical protein
MNKGVIIAGVAVAAFLVYRRRAAAAPPPVFEADKDVLILDGPPAQTLGGSTKPTVLEQIGRGGTAVATTVKKGVETAIPILADPIGALQELRARMKGR